MKWLFAGYQLDTRRAELSGPDGPVQLERLPFNLLCYLIENADRVVSRDELIDNLWSGRIVSETTISTAIKQARKAVGDTGTAQQVIKTVHGVGFRFVASLERVADAPAAPASDAALGHQTAPEHGKGRPGLAVLRFVPIGDAPLCSVLATALPGEILSALSRARWLHVIARGSSFRFDPSSYDPAEVRAKLNIGYIVTGTVEMDSASVTVGVELQSAQSGALVWADEMTTSTADVQLARTRIAQDVVTAMEVEIPRFEALSTRRLAPSHFDAWSHFHLGLNHMFRFTSGDNVIAAQHFQNAIELDPEFARAHSGLSLTHWQNGFMFFKGDRAEHSLLASEAAQRAIAIDPMDPFVNFNMGRAHWLAGDLEGARHWLDRGVALNPNYAHCHYTNCILHSILGDPAAASAAGDKALTLSPMDPLLYGFFASRAVSALMQDDFDNAVRFSELAARSPGTHYHSVFSAALVCEMAGAREAALRWRDRGLMQKKDYSISAYLQTFPFRDKAFVTALKGAGRRLGLPE